MMHYVFFEKSSTKKRIKWIFDVLMHFARVSRRQRHIRRFNNRQYSLQKVVSLHFYLFTYGIVNVAGKIWTIFNRKLYWQLHNSLRTFHWPSHHFKCSCMRAIQMLTEKSTHRHIREKENGKISFQIFTVLCIHTNSNHYWLTENLLTKIFEISLCVFMRKMNHKYVCDLGKVNNRAKKKQKQRRWLFSP